MLNDLRYRPRALFCRDAVERELDRELNFHFENEAEKHRSVGMTHEEAVRRARLSFGGQEQIKEDCREARGTSLVETTIQELRKYPGFFAVAALTLVLGIGASTAVFSLVNTILLKPLPYPNANQVMMLWRGGPLAGIGDMPWPERQRHFKA